MTTSAPTECRDVGVGSVNPHKFSPKVSRRESRRQIRADIDRDSAHYRETQRQKRRNLSDMETVASQIKLVVVEVPDGDRNMQLAEPYYCVPHEAPR